MPWIRYRTYEEAERALYSSEPGPGRWQRIAALWDLARRLTPRRLPQGVRKYRSVEEAQADRERLSDANENGE